MLYIRHFSCAKYNSHWLISDHMTLHKLKCFPIRIHWAEHDQWPGEARDQNVIKAGGVMFLKLASQRFQEFVTFFISSWDAVEQFEAKTGAFYFLFEKWSQKTLEQKVFENAWKVSWFFAFFCKYFTMYLSYICTV